MNIYILSKKLNKIEYLDDIDTISFYSNDYLYEDDIDKLFEFEYIRINDEVKIKIQYIYNNKYIVYNNESKDIFYEDTKNNNINLKIGEYSIDMEDINIYLKDCDDELLLYRYT